MMDERKSAANEARPKVGFWRDPREPRTFQFPDPQDAVDPNWDPTERAAVIAYLRAGRPDIALCGHSWCRFNCGIPKWDMGAWDLTDDVYTWPEGFVHYLEKHDVKPPEEFLEHVRRQLQNR